MSKRRKKQTRSIEDPAVPLSSTAAYDYLVTQRSTTGLPINRQTVLGYPAVWRAVNLVSHKVGKLDLNVFKRQKDGGRTKDTEHPAHWLLTRKPSDLYTCFTFKSTLVAHAMLHGNAYASIFRDSFARPDELIILDPQVTFPVFDGGRLVYVTRIGNQQETKILPENMVHVRGLSHDGIVGYSVIEVLRNAFSLGLAAQRYGEVFFKNNASPGPTIIKLPNYLKDKEAVQRFRHQWATMHEGLDNSHRVALLEGGADIVPFKVSNEDSQWLGTREFEVIQISNILGVPPHKLGARIATSYNSLESEEKSFLSDALDGWLVAIEEEMEAKLLTTSQGIRDSHFVEFDRRSLEQADYKTRSESLIAEVNNGIRSLNEARTLLNLEGVGPDGDRLRMLTNVTFADLVDEVVEDEPSSGDPGQPAEAGQEGEGGAGPAADPLGDVPQRLHSLLASVVARQLTRLEKAFRAAGNRPGFDPGAVLAAHRAVALAAVSPALENATEAVDGLWAELAEELSAVLPEQAPEVVRRRDAGKVAARWLRCGGPGSNRPGPCPEGGADDKGGKGMGDRIKDYAAGHQLRRKIEAEGDRYLAHKEVLENAREAMRRDSSPAAWQRFPESQGRS